MAGRIGVNAWKNTEGEAKASLTFHANAIKLHGAKNNSEQPEKTTAAAKKAPVGADDLPF